MINVQATAKLSYNQRPLHQLERNGVNIASFVQPDAANIDWKTVDSFGEEWTKFSGFSEQDLAKIGSDYFDIVTDAMLNSDTIALDVGCGTGRWTKFVSSRCKFVEAIDPSKAVFAAASMLGDNDNVRITQADVDNIPFEDNSFDFVFSLGVLHHIPDTRAAMANCVEKLKPGGYFLVYLYYNFENKGPLFRGLYHLSNLLRKIISRLPVTPKKIVCDVLAVTVYLPLALLSRIVKAVFGGEIYRKLPLSYYHATSFHIMRNDSLDRFGTPLEQRFSRSQIESMMKSCGLTQIEISKDEPLWHAVGKKA